MLWAEAAVPAETLWLLVLGLPAWRSRWHGS
jgi:hypothetical protein